MVAAKQITHQDTHTPESLPVDAVVNALNDLYALVTDKTGKEVVPGSVDKLYVIHAEMQRLEAMVLGFNAAMVDMKQQRDQVLREMVEKVHDAYKRGNKESIRDISRAFEVTPSVAEYILNIVTGAIDESGDNNFVSSYAANLIRNAVTETAAEIQEAIELESKSLWGDDDDDE
jgi:hypothetical protein